MTSLATSPVSSVPVTSQLPSPAGSRVGASTREVAAKALSSSSVSVKDPSPPTGIAGSNQIPIAPARITGPASFTKAPTRWPT